MARRQAQRGVRLWSESDLFSAAHDAGFADPRVDYAGVSGMPRMTLLTCTKA